MGAPALVGLDWGSSSLRAMLIDAAGDVLASRACGRGVLAVTDRDFEAVLEAEIGDWLAEHRALPILASGMITSRNGWVETPYLPVPAGREELARGLVARRTAGGRTIRFVPGLLADTQHGPDVMRGEETEIVGHVAAGGRRDGILLLPGTHAKWARLAEGRVATFRTFVTGDAFAALARHSMLARLAEPAPFDDAAFLDAALEQTKSAAGPGGLLASLFSARTLVLTGRLPPTAVESRLSGLLVGAEVAEALRGAGNERITVVGRGDLAMRYARVLDACGRAVEIAERTAAARGLAALARAAGLVGGASP